MAPWPADPDGRFFFTAGIGFRPIAADFDFDQNR